MDSGNCRITSVDLSSPCLREFYIHCLSKDIVIKKLSFIAVGAAEITTETSCYFLRFDSWYGIVGLEPQSVIFHNLQNPKHKLSSGFVCPHFCWGQYSPVFSKREVLSYTGIKLR